MNGAYSRVESGGVFSHWSLEGMGGSIARTELLRSSGKWRFFHVTNGGSKLPVAESNHFVRAGGEIPPGDTYSSPRNDYEVSFICCGTGATGQAPSSGKSNMPSTTILLLGGCAVFAV